MSKTILFLALLPMLMASGQPDKKLYVNKVKSICPTADIIEIEVKDDYVEIEYWCNSRFFEVGLNHRQEVIYTESEEKIPDMVMNTIQKRLDKNHYGWVIDEVSMITYADTSFYKIELLRNGIEENVYFTTDGRNYKIKNMIADEEWSHGELLRYDAFKSASYDFLNPDKVYDLPEVLKEVSGIALYDDQTVFCVQDEIGIVFKYDLQNEKIIDMHRFTDLGDFEDLAIIGDTVYVLRSDGTLFYFNHQQFKGKVEQVIVPSSCMNIEGLFYDQKSKTMFMACKDEPVNAKGNKRIVYRFPVGEKIVSETAVSIDLEVINDFFSQKYGRWDKSKVLFNPSAIAVHPITGEKYILSASNRMLAIYEQGKLKDIYPLPSEILYKPEGLDFTPTGDLLISSEGIKKGELDGQILHFSYREQ